jgi:drug/metabolite transporter (DMT)-like permease
VKAAAPDAHRSDNFLAWFFVLVWGSGYIATKTGIQYAAPFTFLTLRFILGLALLMPYVLWVKPRWPVGGREWFHICVAGLLMHGVNLGGSHYAQYLGMSAGIAALILATQPLLTALFASGAMGERLGPRQWLGIAVGLAGVTLVVWHKIDIRAVSTASLVAVGIALAGITAATLYQRHFSPSADLRSASVVQFVVTLAVMAPLAWMVEGFVVNWSWQLLASLAFLVVFASFLAVSALHTLMRRGEATRVSSILYLPPIIAVLMEWAVFGVVPTALSVVGIAITCAGVALVTWRRKKTGSEYIS